MRKLPEVIAAASLAGVASVTSVACTPHEIKPVAVPSVDGCNLNEAKKLISLHVQNGEELKVHVYAVGKAPNEVRASEKADKAGSFIGNPLVLECAKKIVGYVGVATPSEGWLYVIDQDNAVLEAWGADNTSLPVSKDTPIVERTVRFPHPYRQNAVVGFTDGVNGYAFVP